MSIDSASYRYLMQDVSGMKGMLLKLKNVLQEVTTERDVLYRIVPNVCPPPLFYNKN